jgi:hypothetical protein
MSIFPSEDDQVYGPGTQGSAPWECEMPDYKPRVKQEDMSKKKKLVGVHIAAAIDEVKAARAAAFKDIKAAADVGDTKEIIAILDMIEDLETIQGQLEEWQS